MSNEKSSSELNPTLVLPTHSAGVHACQTIGGRKKQEDTFVAGVSDEYKHLTTEQRKRVLELTVAECESDVGAKHQDMGSTLLACAIVGTTIYVANLGDSLAFAVVVDADGNLVSEKSIRLNTKLHNTTDHEERQRVRACGGKIVQNRLDSVLALTRAIGDNFYKGLSHIPDIYEYDCQLAEGEKAFLIVASDGLSNTPDRDQEQIFGLVRYFCDGHAGLQEIEKCGPLDAMVRALIEALYKKEMQKCDNVTVAVTKIEYTDSAASTKVLAVFDGHSGGDVSKELSEKFMGIFQKICKLVQAQSLPSVGRSSVTMHGVSSPATASTSATHPSFGGSASPRPGQS